MKYYIEAKVFADQDQWDLFDFIRDALHERGIDVVDLRVDAV